MSVDNQQSYLRSRLGVVESPPNSNHVSIWDEFRSIFGANYQGSPWCGGLAAVALFHGGWKCPSNFISVAMIRLWGQSTGRYRTGIAGIRQGDLYLFVRDEHVETCVSVGSGFVVGVGGNTSDHGYNPNGGGVYQNTRSPALIEGYVSVADLLGGTRVPVSSVTRIQAAPPGRLVVDGALGPRTWALTQSDLRVPADGIPGPQTYKAMQSLCHVPADGVLGPMTRKAWQSHLGVYADGVWGPVTIKAWQLRLNRGQI